MKVRVQGTHNTIVGAATLEDMLVSGGAQRALARVYDILPIRVQQLDRGTDDSATKQEAASA